MNYRRLIFSAILSLILTVFFISFFMPWNLILELEKIANDFGINPLILMGMPYAIVFILCFSIVFFIFLIRDKSNNQFIRTAFNPVLLFAIFLGSAWGLISVAVNFFIAFEGGSIFFAVLFFPGIIGIYFGGLNIFTFIISIGVAIISLYLFIKVINVLILSSNN